jgi:ribosomal protein S18 acetylase RimI-like enzyme
MQLHRLPADPEAAALRRYVEDLWLPYNRDLEAAVEAFELVDWPDEEIVDAEIEFRRGRLDEDDYRLWVLVDEPDGSATSDALAETADDPALAETDGEFVGFVSASLDESSSVFDRPDRAKMCDIYLREGYRGTGLADDLVDRAAAYAREHDCSQLSLDVDVDNERALGFYEKLGFEPHRHEMTVALDAL